ncbi:uncharacterized protein LOC134377094 [Cynocephalus volans]|uniref:uncharacterized protein LOC134377094 n=1 Tax=Cynocephalus volans TaxID=110931 RepID=UPI002FC6C188
MEFHFWRRRRKAQLPVRWGEATISINDRVTVSRSGVSLPAPASPPRPGSASSVETPRPAPRPASSQSPPSLGCCSGRPCGPAPRPTGMSPQ